LKTCLLCVTLNQPVYGSAMSSYTSIGCTTIGRHTEADDDCAVLGRVDLPVLVVDGEWLTLSVANLSILVVRVS